MSQHLHYSLSVVLVWGRAHITRSLVAEPKGCQWYSLMTRKLNFSCTCVQLVLTCDQSLSIMATVISTNMCLLFRLVRYFVRGLSITISPTDITLAILYYDHALTLPAEIQRFWIRGSLTWPTLLFFVNRYLAFFGHFPVILQTFWNSSDLHHKFAVSTVSYAIESYLMVFSTDVSPLVLPNHLS